MRLSLIIPAAGSGSRMNTAIPKPFLTIGGKTIIEHSLAAFRGIKGLAEIIIPTASEYRELVESVANKAIRDVGIKIIDGGSERMFSVWNALRIVSDSDLVAVHDAVRPFVSRDVIEACMAAAMTHGAAVPAIPVSDTIKKVGQDGFVNHTVDRKYLWAVQTPQVFRREVLMNAYKNAIKTDQFGTDDASLVEQNKGKVYIVPGNPENFKVTFATDLLRAEDILSRS